MRQCVRTYLNPFDKTIVRRVMSNNQRKVKSNWTFPMKQIEDVEAIAEDRGHDSPSELVREWLAEKIEECGGEQK